MVTLTELLQLLTLIVSIIKLMLMIITPASNYFFSNLKNVNLPE